MRPVEADDRRGVAIDVLAIGVRSPVACEDVRLPDAELAGELDHATHGFGIRPDVIGPPQPHEERTQVRHLASGEVDGANEQLGIEPVPEPAVPEQQRIIVADTGELFTRPGPRHPRGIGRQAERDIVHQESEVGVERVRVRRHPARG